jgi:hypothetical protein
MVGYPQYVFSDSGPQFSSAEFRAYCHKHYITPLISSACYPTSNGLAESSVKTVKYLLLKSDSYMDFENRLYERQNMPSSGDTLSPAEKFFKRAFRGHLPTLDKFFNPIQISSEGRKRFQIGDHVRIQNAVSKLWNDSGVIREIRDSGRSYYIDRSPARDVILRNNIFLKLIAPPVAERAKKGLSDSLAEQQVASSQQQVASSQAKEDSTMHELRRSKRIENKSLQLPQNAVRRSQRITKLPVHLVPAVPIQIQNKYLAERRSKRITKVHVVP